MLLNGNNIQDENNNNLAYLNDKQLNDKLDAANKLTGDARYKRLRQPRRRDHAGPRAVGRRWTTATSATSSSERTAGYLFQPANGFADIVTFYINQSSLKKRRGPRFPGGLAVVGVDPEGRVICGLGIPAVFVNVTAFTLGPSCHAMWTWFGGA